MDNFRCWEDLPEYNLRAFTAILSSFLKDPLCLFLNARLGQDRLRFTITCGGPVQACQRCHSQLCYAAAERNRPQSGREGTPSSPQPGPLQPLNSGCAPVGQDGGVATKPTRHSVNPQSTYPTTWVRRPASSGGRESPVFLCSPASECSLRCIFSQVVCTFTEATHYSVIHSITQHLLSPHSASIWDGTKGHGIWAPVGLAPRPGSGTNAL